MDQMFQTPEKSSEQLQPATGPGEVLPQIAPAEELRAPEQGEKQLGAAGAAVQQAYTDDSALAVPMGTLAPQTDSTAAQQAAQSNSATADIDVIEKEWVEKAKSIVSKTKDDPRGQSIELSGMKREYIEKRFGKSLPDNRAA
jgi:hypothetical protein